MGEEIILYPSKYSMKNIYRSFKVFCLAFGILSSLIAPKVAFAYPVFAQQAYESPREATGRIVCANCHLAQKPVELEVPQAVLPDSVFEAVVSIPYDLSVKQVTASGAPGGLNVGSVLILPEGFKLAPKERISDEIKAKTKGVFISPYSKSKPNILVVGPIQGDKHQEVVFPILAPNPAQNKEVHYLNYPIYVGANRGRGQVYPSGEKSNNTTVTSTFAGKITSIEEAEKGKRIITATTESGEDKTQTIPRGPVLCVKVNDVVKADQPLTLDPNVGGFGQTE